MLPIFRTHGTRKRTEAAWYYSSISMLLPLLNLLRPLFYLLIRYLLLMRYLFIVLLILPPY